MEDKLRFYDTQLGKYVGLGGEYCIDKYLTANRIIIADNGNGYYDRINRPANHIVVELCTGVKDTTGTMIFQGDKVSCRYADTTERHIEYVDDLRDFYSMIDTSDGYSRIVELLIVGHVHETSLGV